MCRLGASLRSSVLGLKENPREPVPGCEASPLTVSELAFPKLTELMDAAEEDVLFYAASSTKLWLNKPLKWLDKKVKRRTEVAKMCPNGATTIKPIGVALREQHDEWRVGKRYFSTGSLA